MPTQDLTKHLKTSKSLCLPILFVSLLYFQASGQGIKPRKNHVYIEALGTITTGVGLGYERYSTIIEGLHWTSRVGGGYIGDEEWTANVGGSFFLGGSKHNIEIGGGYLLNYDISTFEIFWDYPRYQNGWQALIGYRLQNWEKGYCLRIYYPSTQIVYIPVYLGVSFGYAF